ICATEHCLDVDDRRSVDGFDRADPEPRAGDLVDSHAMKPQWVRPILRSGGEDTGQWILRVIPRVHLEHVSLRLMQPGDDDDVVAADAYECRGKIRFDVKPRVGCALGALPRCVVNRMQRRTNIPNRSTHVFFEHANSSPPPNEIETSGRFSAGELGVSSLWRQ